MAYEKLGFVDGVTPLDAAHFNHMEDGIEKANSIIETTGGDTLTWDGDTTGKVSFAGMHFKISDATPTIDDFANGATIHVGGAGAIDFTVESVSADKEILSGPDSTFIVVFYDIEIDGLALEKGIYFIKTDSGLYISSLTIPGYTGFATTTIKQDALPEALRFGDEASVLIEEQTITFDGGEGATTAASVPAIGDAVTVEWDGVEYSCQAVDFNGASLVGNGVVVGGEDTGEPFAVMFVSTAQVFVVSVDTEKTSATVKVSGTTTVKISPKYFSAVTTFYADSSPVNDPYIYVDYALTTKATAGEVAAAMKTGLVLLYCDGVHRNTNEIFLSGQYVSVGVVVEYAGALVRWIYYTAEYTAT